MKYLKIAFLATTTLIFLNTHTLKAQSVNEGKIILDGYYGFFNLYKNIFQGIYAATGQEEFLQAKGIPSVGIRVEYMLSDRFGMGVDAAYEYITLSYHKRATDAGKLHKYRFKTSKYGIMLTLNYHFFKRSARTDFYAMVGMGYSNRSFAFSTTDTDFTPAPIPNFWPIAARVGIGLRYYITDHLGFNAALGIGQGGIINAGLTYNFAGKAPTYTRYRYN